MSDEMTFGQWEGAQLLRYQDATATEPEVWIKRTAPGHYTVTYKPHVVITVEVSRD